MKAAEEILRWQSSATVLWAGLRGIRQSEMQERLSPDCPGVYEYQEPFMFTVFSSPVNGGS